MKPVLIAKLFLWRAEIESGLVILVIFAIFQF